MPETLAEHHPHEKSVWPYGQRSGVGTEKYFEAIVGTPEIELDAGEQEKAQQFAAELFEGRYSNELSCGSKRDLGELYKVSPSNDIQEFYLDYFQTDSGKEALSQLGIESSDPDDISASLYNLESIKATISPADRKKIAADSLNWYKDQVAGQLAEPDLHDKEYKDYDSIHVNYNPKKLIDKVVDLQVYRRFLREVRRDLKQQEDTPLHQAEEIILSVYRGRVNEMLANLYVDAVDLTVQLKRETGEDPSLKELSEALPMLAATFMQAREDKVYSLEELTGNFSRRLDFLRNGAAWNDSKDFSPISSELAGLAERLNEEPDIHPSELSGDIIEKLKTTSWNAEQVKEFVETIIGQWDLLSSHQASWTEVKDRDGFAEDGKWQVIISPEVKNMSISAPKKVLTIPEAFNRGLIQESPAGVIPGVSHELTHLIQTEASYLIANDIKLAEVKGRHVSTNKELGAIVQERQAQERFGGKRSTNTHYLSALRIKLNGGNKLEAARAFYESYTKSKQSTPEQDEKDRLLAVDRILRLYRHGGNESQPLDYIEQELLRQKMEELTPADRNKILVIGSVFDLPDLAMLSRAGLSKFPEGLPYNVADDVWRIFSERYLPALLTPENPA